MLFGIAFSGRGPSNSGKLSRGFFPMRKLLDSARTPELEQRYRRLVREVNLRHGNNKALISKITDLTRLKDFIISEINELFAPLLVTFETERSLAQTRETALAETRSIYIPSQGSKNIFVSGQPTSETIEVFEVKAEAMKVNTSSLPNGAQSALVLPLVSSLAIKQPIDKYPRHGAIILSSAKPEAFDPQTDLRALRMIANDLAIVLAQTAQNL